MAMVLTYLRKSFKTLLLIVLLLIIKVIADLSLPFYTADIVNVGIQQGGITTVTPQVISSELLQQILGDVEPEQRTLVLNSYRLDLDSFTERAYVLEIPDVSLDPIFLHRLSDSSLESPNIRRQAAIATIRDDQKRLGVDINGAQMRYIGITGLKMIAISVLGVIASILVAFYASRIAANLGKRLRSDVFAKVLSFGQQELDGFSTASLVTRSTNDIQQIQQSFVMILRVVIFAPLMAIGALFRVLSTNSTMSWTIGVAIIAISTVVITMFALAMPRFKQLQVLTDAVNRVVRETLTGLQVIRAFTTQQHEQQRFEQENEALTATTRFVNRAMSAMMPAMMLIMNLTTVLIVYRGGIHIHAGDMQVGDMMAFIQYAMLIIMSFLMITMLTIMLPRAAVSATRIKEILDTPESLTDPVSPTVLAEPMRGTIRFNQVGFTYARAQSPAIQDISFEARPGTITAIIGSTGSGKSSVLNLIPRFFDVSSGSIEIDGVDIRNLALHQLRHRIGYVPQQGRLFSGTIASNIAFGDTTMSEDRIRQSATIAQAASFIEERPDGYASSIAQGGVNVSGGQRQRLAIARAIASEPKILLLDDCLSALDYRTEQNLRSKLATELRTSTVIIVGQRISSILHADTILVLDEGLLVGKGTHQQLMSSCTVYRQIAQSQLSAEELKQYE